MATIVLIVLGLAIAGGIIALNTPKARQRRAASKAAYQSYAAQRDQLVELINRVKANDPAAIAELIDDGPRWNAFLMEYSHRSSCSLAFVGFHEAVHKLIKSGHLQMRP